MREKSAARHLPVLVVALSFLWCAGCSGFLEQYNLYSSGIRVPGTEPLEELKGKVCVLQATVSTGDEGYQNLASSSLTRALYELKRETGANLEIVPFSQFLNMVNRENLVESYMAMIEAHHRGGILPANDLTRLRWELGIDYVIKPTLVRLEQRSDKRLSVFSVRLLVTKETNAEVSAEIWDTETSEKVWENGRGISIAAERVTESRVSPEDVTRRVWKALFEELVSSADGPAAVGSSGTAGAGEEVSSD